MSETPSDPSPATATPSHLPHVRVCDLASRIGEQVEVRGWLYNRSSKGKLHFLQLRDGSGIVQAVVFKGDMSEEKFHRADHLPQETSLIVRGEVKKDPRSPLGVELQAKDFEIIAQPTQEYPITPKEHGVAFLMDQRHLWLRSKRQVAIMRVRAEVIAAVRSYFDGRGFTLVDAPIFTPNACEGTSNLFETEYHGDKAYLTQSGQLYMEAAAAALGKVYCFGPTFRAEKSKTRRHLSEFWMIEPEVAFYELPDLERLAEDFIAHLVQAVLAGNLADLTLLGRDVDRLRLIQTPFPRVTYSQAVDMLRSPELREKLLARLEADRVRLAGLQQAAADKEKEHAAEGKAWKKDKLAAELQELREQAHELEVDLRNRPAHIDGARDFQWGHDLGGDEETILSKEYDRPLIVTEYPREVKAFYMKRSESDPRVVRNMDVLAPEGYGEIIGGSQREDNLDLLLDRMREEGLDPAPYEWYLDLRRYGSVPHGGFGLGIERTVAWICGLKHIRETIPFPRMMGKMYP